jgi:hypothetical protein
MIQAMPHDQSAHSTTCKTWNDVLPMSFWTTVASSSAGGGGATELGFVIDMTAAMKKQEEELPGRDDTRMIESVGKGERWYEKVEDSFHVHVETLSTSAFLSGAEKFLRSVGLDGPTQISVDEESLPQGEAQAKLNMEQAVGVCSDFLSKNGESVRTIEITSHGRNDEFSLMTDFSYRRKHRPVQPPIELEVNAMSNELGPRKGESFADYRARMNALDTDSKRKKEVYDQIEAGKKAVYSDFAHHLEEAFPGVKLQFYEKLNSGEA